MRFQVDWITITVHAPIAVAHAFLHDLDVYEYMTDVESHARGYSGYKKSPHEMKLYHTPLAPEQEHWCLECPSDAIHNVDYHKLFSGISHFLRNYRCNVTRLDLAYDTQVLDNDLLWQWIKDEKITTRVKRENIRRIENCTGSDYTIYYGQRTSESFLRTYKKQVENDEFFGNEYFLRLELELHNARATSVMTMLTGLPFTQWYQYYFKLLGGFIVFDDDRWRNFLVQNENKPVYIKTVKRQSNIKRAGRWLHRQVLPTMSMYVEFIENLPANRKQGAKEELLEWLFQKGKSKMSLHQKKLVKSARVPRPHKSLHVSEVDYLYDGTDFNALVTRILDGFNHPLRDFVSEMSDWEKSRVYYLAQIQQQLPGVDWSQFVIHDKRSHYDM